MKDLRFGKIFFIAVTIQLISSCGGPSKDRNGVLLFKNLESKNKKEPFYFEGEPYSGPIVKYYKNGLKEFEGSYKEGRKKGPWYYYHESGKLKREETAQPSEGAYEVKTYRRTYGRLYTELIGKGKDTIHYKKYHHNGKLGQELIQKDGYRIFQKWSSFGNLYHYYNSDSIVIIMDIKTKEIRHKGRFVNGKRDGFWFKYRKNGNKEYEKNYKQGELLGKSIEYFNNGNVDMISNYNNNGILEGDYKRYHLEGGIWVDGEYDYLGKRTGTWLYYNEQGKLTGLSSYVSNELNGYYEEYTSEGRLREKGYFEKNRKVGVWFYYDTYGKFLRKEYEGPRSSTFKVNPDKVL
jgi:antitoxin component YwqK of YwqJK toxin-antitoxin module